MALIDDIRLDDAPQGSPVESDETFHGLPLKPHGRERQSIPFFTTRSVRADKPLVGEMPWHRQFAQLLTVGKTGKECAEWFGKTEQECSLVRTQPWFKLILEKLAEEAGKTLLDRIEAEANASLDVVVEIRDNVNAPASARLNAAESILGRLVPKKTESTVRHAVEKDTNDEEAKLLKQLDLLSKQTGVAVGRS